MTTQIATQVALTGNEAVAEALRQVDPDVAAVYPITPQTELMHAFAAFAADGVIDTELVMVESEHSAMSAAVGASAAGARAITATSSQGLALMWEIVYIASSYRLPIVAPVVNRALSGPINIHCDHSDTMGARDSGWIQIFSEGSQE
ncbi:MAG: pyruvate ferredoxin oxidoreductase, partial [Planctomycetes bacterium]|nr:pyruvate ferredoxin oxidoreductase [Planctomycetota bacterium]